MSKKNKNRILAWIYIVLIALGIFAVGIRVGYNKAIKDARLFEDNGNQYTIGFGDEKHGWSIHEYTMDN